MKSPTHVWKGFYIGSTFNVLQVWKFRIIANFHEIWQLSGDSWNSIIYWHQFHSEPLDIQSSAVITRSNLSWYYIGHCDNNGRKWIWYWNHNRHPTSRPDGWAMGVYCEDFRENWAHYNGLGDQYGWVNMHIIYKLFMLFRSTCISL